MLSIIPSSHIFTVPFLYRKKRIVFWRIQVLISQPSFHLITYPSGDSHRAGMLDPEVLPLGQASIPICMAFIPISPMPAPGPSSCSDHSLLRIMYRWRFGCASYNLYAEHLGRKERSRAASARCHLSNTPKYRYPVRKTNNSISCNIPS